MLVLFFMTVSNYSIWNNLSLKKDQALQQSYRQGLQQRFSPSQQTSCLIDTCLRMHECANTFFIELNELLYYIAE